MAPKARPVAERFWEKVDKSGSCWMWTASKDIHGYGKFKLRRGTDVGAHRLAYILTNGEPPEGLHLDHLCRNRACVNPDHLEPVPPRTNALRGVGIGAINAAKTFCDSGHEFTPENTYRQPNTTNKRACKECRRITNREWMRGYARRKAGRAA